MLTLLGVEALLRLELWPERPRRTTVIEDRARSAGHEPDFREPGFRIEEKKGAFRILVIGDSFAWGDGVYYQDAFPYRLENRLNEVSRGERFEVINWSRPGWNTVRQLHSLTRELQALEPDLAILTFVLNDPEPVEKTKRREMLASVERRQPSPGLSAWLFDRSRLYAMVWTRVENTRTHRELSAYYHRLFEGEHWELCRRALRRLRNHTSRWQIPLILVILPVFDSPMDDRYPYLDLNSKIRMEAESLGIGVLDLMDTFWGLDTHRLAVVPFTDAHPSEIAHRVMADAILDHVVRKRLVPPVNQPPQKRRRRPAR